MTKRRKVPAELRHLVAEARSLESTALRKHHLVPASYLRRWAEDGLLRVTDINSKHDYKTSPAKAARQTDFYRLESDDLDADELPPLLFEVVLSRVEEWGKEGIDALLTAPTVIDPLRTAQFAFYLGTQFTRGAAFRAELQQMTNAMFKLQFGDLSDDGIRQELVRRGANPTEDLVESSRRLLDGINNGSYRVSLQDAAAVAQAGEMAYALGEHFLERTWVVFETPKTMITSDEPVTLVGGPGSPRDERAGVATAGVILLPLNPSHVLAMFRDDVAARIGTVAPPGDIQHGRLGPLETSELRFEVAMNAHRWTFERPSKRVAANLSLGPPVEAFSIEEVGEMERASDVGLVIRSFKKNRFTGATLRRPWPVAAWWN